MTVAPDRAETAIIPMSGSIAPQDGRLAVLGMSRQNALRHAQACRV
jgi:hypothetical protein